MSDPSSGSEPRSDSASDPASDPDSPYQTSLADLFISPYTPFLHHLSVLEEDAPFQRWCEQRRIYYALCTHTTDSYRCNNPDNPNRRNNFCDDSCRRPPEYVTYSNSLCPICNALGRPSPEPTEADRERLNTEYRSRTRESRSNFDQYISDAEQTGNLSLQVLDDPEDLFEDPDIIGQEILAELAAAIMEDASEVMDEDSDYEGGGPGGDGPGGGGPGGGGPGGDGPGGGGPGGGGPGGGGPEDNGPFENFLEFDPNEPRPDLSEGWVARQARTNSTLTSEQWFGRLAWRTASAREMGNPPGPYYVPNDANNETNLLVRPEPLSDEETCAICIMDFEAHDDVCRLPCRHLFHYECILRWLYNRNCPVCRHEYVLRRLPLFADEEGEGDSSNGGGRGESPPSPGVPHIGGIPLIPGGELGRALYMAGLQGGAQQAGDPQGGEQQGAARG